MPTTNRSLHRLALALPLLGLSAALAQTPTPPPQQPVQQAQSSEDNIVVAPPVPLTPEQQKQAAWTLLTTSVADSKHPDLRIQTLAALGILGENPRSLKLITDTLSDPDVDVRTAAVLAAGQTKSPNVTGPLRQALDDKEPQVVFAAATTLWKLNDRSGEDVLVAVVDGERSSNPGLMHGAMHDAHRELQHPGSIARMGALQGAGMLLGPFGFGITAFEYMHNNGADQARVQAVEQIAQNHTAPIRRTLLAALGDKDLAVRVSAAKALGQYHEPDVAPALANLLSDSKPPVRLTAAAAYLLSTGTVAEPSSSPASHTRKAR